MSQSRRKSQLIDKLCRHAMEYYAADGSFHGPWGVPDERDLFRTASILLAHGGEKEQAVAEALIRNSFGGPDDDYTKLSLQENVVDILKADVRDWNIFQSNIGTSMLVNFRERLSTEIREKLERIARRNLSRYAGSAQADYFFHGANDNMPAHATAGLILASEYLGDEQGLTDGVYRLNFFAELLSRRGLCSEFASGTYLPLTISAMAEIASHAKDPAIAELALQIEHQLWADIVCHYHPGSGKSAGPQTRAYNVNTVAHLDCIMTLLWTVTGEPPFTNPVRDLITLQPKQATHFEGDAFKTACGVVNVLLPEFHFPDHLLPLLTERPQPFRFFASAEQMYGGNPDVGGRESSSTVHQTADYSLATSPHGFMTGNQSESVRIAWRCIEEPKSFHDTNVAIFRFLHNDEHMGTMTQVENCPPSEKGLIANRALFRTLQHDDTALLVSRADDHNVPLPATLHRLGLHVSIPAHYSEPRALFIGDRRIDEWQGESAEAAPVFVDLGRMYLALYPLAMTDCGRQAVIRIESHGDYRSIVFLNYEGAPREFTAEELRETLNGCVVHLSGPAESGDFAAFRKGFGITLLEDWLLANNRRTRLIFRGHELLHNWSIGSDTVRSATIDGREPPRHRLHGTGLDISKFPLQNDYKPRVGRLPYDNLEVAWYPHLHWQIGARIGTDTGASH